MIRPFHYVSKEEERYDFNIERKTLRGTISAVSIADIHFGVIEPKIEYEILKKQFIDEIEKTKLDLIIISGDLFNRKYMSNTDPILYANKFIGDIVLYCKKSNCVLIILEGTKEHDAGQLKLFYHYMEDPDIDIRIIENIGFEYIKGVKVLCLPELYGIDEYIYTQFLQYSGCYDMCVMHGTMTGSVYNNNVGQGRLFSIEDFSNCKGPIISGHIHTGGCFNSHFYYTGSPIRWQFGEENDKGFLILLYNLDTRKYYMHLQPIHSFKYSTINLDELITSDPNDIVKYINELKDKDNIDYIRIEFNKDIPSDNLEIIKSYYRNNGTVKFKIDNKKPNKNNITSDNVLIDEYDYLFDTNLNEYDKLAKYINDQQNSIFVTADKIKSLLQDK